MTPAPVTKPLVDYLKGNAENKKERAYTDLCTQIDNILNSYDDRLDSFAEIVQNSVDEILNRVDVDPAYVPYLEVHIDLRGNTLEVIDNAAGIAPTLFPDVLRPNCSLKRLKQQKHARGEKGAAMVFLQFGHNHFLLESKHPDGNQTYTLACGRTWFTRLEQVIFGEGDFASKEPDLPSDTYSQSGNISNALNPHERGCRVMVGFGEGCKLSSLASLFGSKSAVALDRLEHILRTRTAIGFITSSDPTESLPECLKGLKVKLRCTDATGVKSDKSADCGFFFPHLYKTGLKSLMTNPKRNSELLYEYFTKEFIRTHLADVFQQYRAIIDRYKVTGYFSYAWNNYFYEERAAKHLSLAKDDPSEESLVPVNAGFQVGVKDYPNGPRHNFFHRHGSEHRSRTYVVINFCGDYKPDYGRKNVAAEVKPFVLALCKGLIGFATTRDRALYMKVDGAASPGGVANVEDARVVRDAKAAELADVGFWVDPEGGGVMLRPPDSENEVIAEFCHLVIGNELKGFILYGLDPTFHYDGMFRYEIKKSMATEYARETCSLGLEFSGSETIVREKKWLEFKKSADLLVGDFKKRDGEEAKKYFVLVDLLVCDKADLDEEGYSCEEIVTDEQVTERRYYGVTHLLRCSADLSHVIQVISLDSLRRRVQRGTPPSGSGES